MGGGHPSEQRAAAADSAAQTGGVVGGLFVYLTDLPGVAQSHSKRLVSVSEELLVAMVTGQQSVEVRQGAYH